MKLKERIERSGGGGGGVIGAGEEEKKTIHSADRIDTTDIQTDIQTSQ